MAWYNPATWTVTDNIQNGLAGSTFQSGGSTGGSSPTSYSSSGIAGSTQTPVNTSAGDYATGDPYTITTTTPYSIQAPQQQQVDHTYDQWGGQDKYNNLVSGFANQKQNIFGTANDAASQLGDPYHQSILDTIHNLTQGQQAIDRKNVNNESSRLQSTQGILGSVGQGIRSGGVYLAGRNAGNSSAAQAIANAYGQIGRQQMSQVGNQFAKNQGDIALDQQNQDWATSQAPNKFHLQLTQDVNNIVNQARDKFSQLDAAMASASLPDRIAIEQEKESVRSQVLGQLQQYDAQMASGVGNIHASDRETNMTNAQNQLQAGTADPNMFQYSTEAPLQVQNSGPTASNLPLFSLGKRRLA